MKTSLKSFKQEYRDLLLQFLWRQQVRNQLKELDKEADRITDKILQVADSVIGEKMRKKIKALTERKNDLVMDEVRLNREIEVLKSDQINPDILQGALRNFSDAVKMLPEDEQRELFKLLFKSIIVREGGKATDTANENTRRKRQPRRHLTLDIKLRTEAIQTLFGSEEATEGRKNGFNIPLEIAHCPKNPMEHCGILSPVQMECGHKAPKIRKYPKKTEHEIHRAIRWKKEMEELGIGQNQLGRMNGLTSAAMTQAMRWLRLCPDVQNLLRSIKDHRVIRRLGRRTVFKLLNLPANQQLERIRELMKNDC